MKSKLAYFYSWPASILAANLALLVGNLLVFNTTQPEERLPSYANAMVNLIYRFPLWVLFTIILTVLFINVFRRKTTLTQRFNLYVMNFLTWILSGFIFIGLYVLIPINWDVIITFPVYLIGL